VEIALANTQGTKHMLDHAKSCDAKLLFASTSEVYGNPETHPQSETYNGNVNIRGIRGCYDESKRFGETLIAAYRREYSIDARTVRIFNTYGPRMRPDDGRVIPTFVNQALEERDLTIYGDGEQTRSFCYINDLIRGLISITEYDNPDYDVYNIGNVNEISIKKLANMIIEITGSSSNLKYESLPEDDPSRRRPNLNRIIEDIGWEPEIPLSQGLTQTISYYKSNRHR